MWKIFKDENEYNEKAIIGFISFAVMVMFGVVDLVTGLMGQDLVIFLLLDFGVTPLYEQPHSSKTANLYRLL
jgi:hypothetical protein